VSKVLEHSKGTRRAEMRDEGARGEVEEEALTMVSEALRRGSELCLTLQSMAYSLTIKSMFLVSLSGISLC
jgi:hypothetical protein